MLFLIVWPGLAIHYLYDKIRRKYPAKNSHPTVEHIDQPYVLKDELSLSKCCGGGIILCKECGFEEKIIAGVHHQTDGDYRLGYQCQKCGKFIAILDPFKYEKLPKCDCGGELSQENLVFCSKCGSKNVYYKMTYIT